MFLAGSMAGEADRDKKGSLRKQIPGDPSRACVYPRGTWTFPPSARPIVGYKYRCPLVIIELDRRNCDLPAAEYPIPDLYTDRAAYVRGRRDLAAASDDPCGKKPGIAIPRGSIVVGPFARRSRSGLLVDIVAYYRTRLSVAND